MHEGQAFQHLDILLIFQQCPVQGRNGLGLVPVAQGAKRIEFQIKHRHAFDIGFKKADTTEQRQRIGHAGIHFQLNPIVLRFVDIVQQADEHKGGCIEDKRFKLRVVAIGVEQCKAQREALIKIASFEPQFLSKRGRLFSSFIKLMEKQEL